MIDNLCVSSTLDFFQCVVEEVLFGLLFVTGLTLILKGSTGRGNTCMVLSEGAAH